MNKKEDKIPEGIYCHRRINEPCPYWDVRKFHLWDTFWVIKREGKFAYKMYDAKNIFQLIYKIYKTEAKHGVYKCKYMKYKDTYQGESLLWDMVKECSVKDDIS